MSRPKVRDILKEYTFERSVGDTNMQFNLNDEDVDELAIRILQAGHISIARRMEKK